MTQKSTANSNSDAVAKIVLFGVDDDCKPHAAWFPKTQVDPARAAAKQLRLNVIEVTNGTAAEIVAKLPPGRIRKALIENVEKATLSRGVATRQDAASGLATVLPEPILG
jgi:hypothetical protein